VVSLLALGLAVPTLAASDHSLGEGSSADNERLLPGVYPTDPVLASGQDVPEPPHPPLLIDWSLGLRGTYTNATSGERFDTRLIPSVSLEHLGTRSRVKFDANAEVVRPGDGGNIDVGALRLNLETEYDLDSATKFTANGNFSMTRDLPGTPGVASNVAVAPQTLSGGAALGLSRDFGRFNVSVTGAAQRNVYGTTTLVDGTVADNSGQNYWAFDSALRVGFQATPIFEVFGQAGLGRDIGDHPSAALGVTTNANDYSVKGGVTGRWNRLEATGSAGLALRRFDEASLGQVVTQLYDAQVVFTPDPTWRMLAGFATTVAPPGPNGSGTTWVDYTARAEVGYQVNSWLALRAVADWNRARFEGSSDTETGHGYGLGADYRVNAHTDVSTDYAYDRTDSTSNGVQDAHRVTMGITVSR
jgi:hypothetical protein